VEYGQKKELLRGKDAQKTSGIRLAFIFWKAFILDSLLPLAPSNIRPKYFE
jgi:hypothetical protein